VYVLKPLWPVSLKLFFKLYTNILYICKVESHLTFFLTRVVQRTSFVLWWVWE